MSLNQRVYRSTGVFVDSSSERAQEALASLQHRIQFVPKNHKLYILCGVEEESFAASAGEIIDETIRKRVLKRLSINRSVNVKIHDLEKLKGFLDWSWKDIQKKLYKIKIEVEFLLYIKGAGQLMKAREDLQLAHLYELGDTGNFQLMHLVDAVSGGNF